MTDDIEQMSWTENRWLCKRGHKHITIDKARNCNLRSERAAERNKRISPIAEPGHLSTEEATSRFAAHNFIMSHYMIGKLYTYGFLRGYRKGKGAQGRIFVREEDIDNLVAWIKALWGEAQNTEED